MRISAHSLCSLVLVFATCGCTPQKVGPAPSDVAKADRAIVGVQIELTLSDAVFDAANPGGTIRCVVRNETRETVQVPATYDGTEVTLVCTSHRYPLRLLVDVDDPAGPPRVDLKVGETHTLFEYSLAALLRVQPRPADGRRPDVSWDWKEHPMPPMSPIHAGRGDELLDQASFRAELRVGDSRITSNEVILKVSS